MVKDRIWPAGLIAFGLHGMMVAAFALCKVCEQAGGTIPLQVDIIFSSTEEKSTPHPLLHSDLSHKGRGNKQPVLAASTSPLVGEVAAKERVRGNHPIKTHADASNVNTQEYNGEKNNSPDTSPLYNPSPPYPLEARRKRAQGVVHVRLSVSQQGTVDTVTALSPHIDPLLEEAALKAIRQWRFKPGVRTLEIPIEFRLET